MSFINIHTNNLSKRLKNSTTFVDNWVYVPGTSITGDYSAPMLFENVDDFINTCGDHGVEGSITYEYVTGLLSSGLPVIFRRIACIGQDTSNETPGVECAKVVLTHPSSTEEESTDINDVTITEKWGGTYGNYMSISVRNTGSSYWLDVYYKNKIIEQKMLTSYTQQELQDEEVEHAIADRLIKALQDTNWDKIKVEVTNKDKTKFVLREQTKQLSGGSDMSDKSLIVKEIAKSYEAISDKLLFQPKFITSGGYTDSDLTTSSTIADAMLALTRERQDCRALIDLPLRTLPTNYMKQVESIGYQQLSSEQVIPSGSVCAPWVYMQVDNAQKWMPPSYAYLTVVGNAISNGGEAYTPKAGLANGQIPNVIKTEFEIGSARSDEWQSDDKVNINPIMKLQGGRYVIAGNSTLLRPDASGEENVFSESSADLTIIDIRRFVYNIATELRFQYNSEESFETFALRVGNYLDKMESEGAITDYDIANVSTSDEPRKLKIQLNIYLTPTIKAIEIYLNVSYGSVSMVSGGEN